MASADTVVVTSIGGESVADLPSSPRGSMAWRPSTLEINLSCPNVRAASCRSRPTAHGRAGGRGRAPCDQTAIRPARNVSDIAEIARGRSRRRPRMTASQHAARPCVDSAPADRARRLLGHGIKPSGCVAPACARAVAIPVIGCGGVSRASDVLEYPVVGCRGRDRNGVLQRPSSIALGPDQALLPASRSRT